MTTPTSVCSTPIAHLREGRRLEYLTIAWNAVEAIVSIAAGLMAGFSRAMARMAIGLPIGHEH